ncbi:MAG: hypothetical protein R3D00_22285 [Bacteroidia bacterium]
MVRRDYFLKMIEEAGYALARILGLRKEGRYEEAFDLINDTLKSYFPFDRELVHHTSPDDLGEFLVHEHKLTEEHLALLADVLRAEGDIWYARGEWENANSSLRRALALIQYLDNIHPEEYSFDRANKLAEIKAKLKGETPPATDI